VSETSNDPVVSAIRKLDDWFQTLGPQEQQVISNIVQRAVTPAEELVAQDASGYSSLTCRGLASSGPTLVSSFGGGGLGTSAAIFMLEGPPKR
jgi:hypothetical protein